jgi:hypothetical protein
VSPTTKACPPSTGLTTSGCYAHELRDCDGEPCNREHPTSKSILEEIGSQFMVSGYAWTKGRESPASPGTLWSDVLCKRHNTALSEADAAGVALYRAFDDYHRGVDADDLTIDGDMLERWPLKAAAGHVASGQAVWKEGASVPSAPIPTDYVRALFDEIEISDGCGLHLIENGSPLPASNSLVHPLTHPLDHSRAGVLYGASFAFLMTPIVSIVEPVPVPGRRVWRRPAGLIFGTRRIALTWRTGPASDWVTLRTPRLGGT